MRVVKSGTLPHVGASNDGKHHWLQEFSCEFPVIFQRAPVDFVVFLLWLKLPPAPAEQFWENMQMQNPCAEFKQPRNDLVPGFMEYAIVFLATRQISSTRVEAFPSLPAPELGALPHLRIGLHEVKLPQQFELCKVTGCYTWRVACQSLISQMALVIPLKKRGSKF